MSEWLKILLSALAGVITGVLLEPVKRWIGDRITAHYAKEAMYAELGRLYYVAKYCCSDLDPRWIKGYLQSSAFDYYYNSKREILYLLPDYEELIWHFEMIKSLRKLLENNEKTPREIVETVNSAFDSRLEGECFDQIKLEKHGEKMRARQSALRKGRLRGES